VPVPRGPRRPRHGRPFSRVRKVPRAQRRCCRRFGLIILAATTYGEYHHPRHRRRDIHDSDDEHSVVRVRGQPLSRCQRSLPRVPRGIVQKRHGPRPVHLRRRLFPPRGCPGLRAVPRRHAAVGKERVRVCMSVVPAQPCARLGRGRHLRALCRQRRRRRWCVPLSPAVPGRRFQLRVVPGRDQQDRHGQHRVPVRAGLVPRPGFRRVPRLSRRHLLRFERGQRVHPVPTQCGHRRARRRRERGHVPLRRGAVRCCC
jgi:hypothetical protein